VNTSSTSKSCCSAGTKRGGSWASDRRLLIAAALVIGAGALWMGWPWLVVAGVAPLLVALAPCLLMCGAMCAVKACCKPSPKADAVTQEAPKLLTNAAQNKLPSPEFSRDQALS
jgi:hypothetical protein